MSKLYIFFFAVLLSCSGNVERGEKHPPQDVRGAPLEDNDYLKIKAEQAYSLLIDTCLTKKQLLIRDYLTITPKLYQLIKYSDFQYTCEIIEENVGLVKSSELVEGFYSKDKLLKIFRFRLECEKIDQPVELRLLFTDSNKLTEYRFFEWADDYKEDIIRMNWF